LQEGGSFAGWAVAAVGAVRDGEFGQPVLVGLELFPGDVSGVRVGDQHSPLVARQGDDARPATGCGPVGVPAVEERAGVAGVVQYPQHPGVFQRSPHQFAFAFAGADAAGEGQALLTERFHRGQRRAGGGERDEQMRHGLLHPGVRVKDHLAGVGVDQSDR
jgi:hypothetical protein